MDTPTTDTAAAVTETDTDNESALTPPLDDERAAAIVRNWIGKHVGDGRVIRQLAPTDPNKYCDIARAELDAAAQIRGDRRAINGASPLLADGTTYAARFDFDQDDRGLPYAREAQGELARSAHLVSVVHDRSEPGRSRAHLSLTFSAPILPTVALLEWLYSVAPTLRFAREAFPFPGDEKAGRVDCIKQAVSLSLTRLSSAGRVVGCPARVLLPAGELLESPGLLAGPDALASMARVLGAGVADSSRIPASTQQPAPAMSTAPSTRGGVSGRSVSVSVSPSTRAHDGEMKAACEAWARNNQEWVIARHNLPAWGSGSPWAMRDEQAASTKWDAAPTADGRYTAQDYGARRKWDALDLHIELEALDKARFLREVVLTEYRFLEDPGA